MKPDMGVLIIHVLIKRVREKERERERTCKASVEGVKEMARQRKME